MSMETQIDEVRALAVKLAAVTDRIEGRLVQVSEANSAASQAMVLAARQAGQVADDLTRNALAQFKPSRARLRPRGCAGRRVVTNRAWVPVHSGWRTPLRSWKRACIG